ncbi:hypothetical protein PUN28_011845 [Cardiocondyla obscurior]|uniref:Uncharacterized protein n=1 Tax=Cardiocondyla obscurior TaxID=286306 RepID=A0AAW2FIH8_9HYME
MRCIFSTIGSNKSTTRRCCQLLRRRKIISVANRMYICYRATVTCLVKRSLMISLRVLDCLLAVIEIVDRFYSCVHYTIAHQTHIARIYCECGSFIVRTNTRYNVSIDVVIVTACCYSCRCQIAHCFVIKQIICNKCTVPELMQHFYAFLFTEHFLLPDASFILCRTILNYFFAVSLTATHCHVDKRVEANERVHEYIMFAVQNLTKKIINRKEKKTKI